MMEGKSQSILSSAKSYFKSPTVQLVAVASVVFVDYFIWKLVKAGNEVLAIFLSILVLPLNFALIEIIFSFALVLGIISFLIILVGAMIENI